jgi:hypothetical protein
MVLQQLQSVLTQLYAVSSDYAVADFLVTDHQRLGLAQRPATDEQVLLSESDEGLRVSVYISEQVLCRLAIDSPLNALSDSNLSDYCTALEGVSHFHYLTWRAMHLESVSLLELELQAEVDKYVAAVWLYSAQCGRFPTTLHERMFHRVQFYAELDAESEARYKAANRGAARYCRELDERYLRGRRAQPEAWLQELRKFYRLSHAQKLRRVAA